MESDKKNKDCYIPQLCDGNDCCMCKFYSSPIKLMTEETACDLAITLWQMQQALQPIREQVSETKTMPEKIIEDICECLHADPDKLKCIFSHVKMLGYVGTQEALHFSSIGIPLIGIFSNVRKLQPDQVFTQIKDGKISYSDLCVALEIFSQKIMTQAQNKAIDS